MMYYRISKNEKYLFFGKKIRPGVGSDLNMCILFRYNSQIIFVTLMFKFNVLVNFQAYYIQSK